MAGSWSGAVWSAQDVLHQKPGIARMYYHHDVQCQTTSVTGYKCQTTRVTGNICMDVQFAQFKQML